MNIQKYILSLDFKKCKFKKTILLFFRWLLKIYIVNDQKSIESCFVLGMDASVGNCGAVNPFPILEKKKTLQFGDIFFYIASSQFKMYFKFVKYTN